MLFDPNPGGGGIADVGLPTFGSTQNPPVSATNNPVVVSGAPQQVPVVSGAGSPTGTVNTSTTTPLTVGAATALSSLQSNLTDAIAHPSQHLLLIAVLLLSIWFVSKHLK